MDHLCYFCLILLSFHAHLFVDALWSAAGKELTLWLSFVVSNWDVVTFPIGILGWVWCLIVSYLIFTLFLTLNRFHGAIYASKIQFNDLCSAVFWYRLLIG